MVDVPGYINAAVGGVRIVMVSLLSCLVSKQHFILSQPKLVYVIKNSQFKGRNPGPPHSRTAADS